MHILFCVNNIKFGTKCFVKVEQFVLPFIYTTIKGYTHPLEFYSPQYLPSQPLPSNDRRRTLYWNPNIETDENGEATIHCFNASKSTFLTISAETIHDGQPASLNIHSIGLDESKTDHLQ